MFKKLINNAKGNLNNLKLAANKSDSDKTPANSKQNQSVNQDQFQELSERVTFFPIFLQRNSIPHDSNLFFSLLKSILISSTNTNTRIYKSLFKNMKNTLLLSATNTTVPPSRSLPPLIFQPDMIGEFRMTKEKLILLEQERKRLLIENEQYKTQNDQLKSFINQQTLNTQNSTDSPRSKTSSPKTKQSIQRQTSSINEDQPADDEFVTALKSRVLKLVEELTKAEEPICVMNNFPSQPDQNR